MNHFTQPPEEQLVRDWYGHQESGGDRRRHAGPAYSPTLDAFDANRLDGPGTRRATRGSVTGDGGRAGGPVRGSR